MVKEFINITDLLSTEKIVKEETYSYITRGLIPNLQGLFRHIQSEIEKQPDLQEQMYLHERKFVESIKLLTHPEIAKRLQLIAEDLNEDEDRPYHTGMVLVGSAAFGGLLIRESLGTDNGSDLDIVGTYVKVVADDETPVFDFMDTSVLPKIKSLINSSMIKSKDTNDYETCDAHNVKIMNFEAIDDQEKADALLEQIAQDEHTGHIGEYFLPSYPSSLNDVSRHFLLQALHQLAESDQEKWIKVKGKIVSSFEKSAKIIKPKHFGKQETELEEEVLQKMDRINEYLSALFQELIDATNY